MRHTTITPEKVLEIEKCLNDYPMLSVVQVAKLTDVSKSTVSRVRAGEYSHLFYEKPVEPEPERESVGANDALKDIAEGITQLNAALKRINETLDNFNAALELATNNLVEFDDSEL